MMRHIEIKFTEAITVLQTEKAKALITPGGNVNAGNNDGITPLHLATNGDIDIARGLIAAGVDLDAYEIYGKETPIHFAVDNSNLHVVNELVKFGANVNQEDVTKCTPLHYAAKNGNKGIVYALLKARHVNLNPRSRFGETPLFLAIGWYHDDVVNVLIGAGADVNIPNDTKNTPLHEAIDRCNLSIVRALIRAGADVDAKNKKGDTALHMAIRSGEIGIAKVLIEARANVSIPNNRKNTPFHVAARYDNLLGLRLLLTAGSHKNLVKATNQFGCTPLHVAVVHNKLSVAQALIDAGADLHQTTNDERMETPLDLAKGNTEMCNVIELALALEISI